MLACHAKFGYRFIIAPIFARSFDGDRSSLTVIPWSGLVRAPTTATLVWKLCILIYSFMYAHY